MPCWGRRGGGWGFVDLLAVDTPIVGLDDKVLDMIDVQALLVERLRIAEAGHNALNLFWLYLRFLSTFIRCSLEGEENEGKETLKVPAETAHTLVPSALNMAALSTFPEPTRLFIVVLASSPFVAVAGSG